MFAARAARFLALLAAVAGTGACNAGDGHPPVARASADPMAIPENDGFQTPVTLDGSLSADPVDDPDGLTTLTYQWSIRGDEHELAEGSLTSVAPVVRFRGDRPATIELTVTDEDGYDSTTRFELQLTVTE